MVGVLVGHHIHGEKGSKENLGAAPIVVANYWSGKNYSHGKYGSEPPPCCFSEDISLIF